MLSMMILFSSQKIILLCLPISSTYRYFTPGSPISFKCSMEKHKTRSSPGWVTERTLPFPIYLRSTIQKFGAVSGLGLFSDVKQAKGRDAFADSSKRLVCPGILKVKSSSSFSGCAIFPIL